MPHFAHVCGPNEVLVVSGCCHKTPQYVPGGRVLVLPCFHRLDRISLNIMTLIIESPRIYSKKGVPITVTGVAQVKIESSSDEKMNIASQNFLGKTENEIQAVLTETLEGHQRAIIGSMTVEEIYKDRKAFATNVFQTAIIDMGNMGIKLVSYTLKDISDDEGYLEALGKKRIAEAKRDAQIGEAEAQMEAGIGEAKAENEKIKRQLRSAIKVEKSKKNLNINNAVNDKQINTALAKVEHAYELQALKMQQLIKLEEMNIDLVRQKQLIELEELEKTKQNFTLLSSVHEPAKAERFRLETLATADKNRVIAESEAEAKVVQLIGKAEAESLRAMLIANAENKKKLAGAYKNCKETAMLNSVLETLPKVAAEIACPISECDKITMVASGNGEIGISKLTGEIISVIKNLPTVITSMAGVEMVGLNSNTLDRN